MRFLSSFSVALLTLTSTIVAKSPPACLSDKEADTIATNWLKLWSVGGVSTLSALAEVVTSDIENYDYSYGDPNIGIQSLYETLTATGNFTTSDVQQFPLFTIHSCDQVVTRWGYTAKSTGFESTLPVGTPVSLYGIEILHVRLDSRLIFNATSSADWVNLARGIGETVNL